MPARGPATPAERLAWLEAHPDLWKDLPEEWSPLEPYVRTILTRIREAMTDAGLYSPYSHSGDVEMSVFKTVLRVRRKQTA